MKNWNYIEGAKTGNGILDIFKSEKPIKMKSSKGAIVTIHPDGSAAHQEKEGSQMAVHHYNSFKEAVEYYKNQGYVKVGNETLHEYATSKPRVINEGKTGDEEFFKKLSDDVKEREKKDDADIEKVGNSSISGGTFKSDDGSQKAVIDVNPQSGTARVVWFENDRQNGSSDYRSIDLATAAVKRKGLKKVGNSMVGNYSKEELLKYAKQYGDKELIDHIMSGKMTQAELGARTRWFQYQWDGRDINGKIVDKEKAGNKIGNARYTTREDVISHLDTDLYDICKKVPAASPSYAYVSELQKKGWDISTISKYSKEIGKIIDRYKAGNAKTGNSASDDKFAYVMREFDEGKLKTPDGKVVTDPAQAKAIAYSESKKTENGLARARNAMK